MPTINADLGESIGIHSFGNDEGLFPLVDLVNIAAGMHAGDPTAIARAVEGAVAHGTAIGVHPGLPDIAGFGRRAMALDADEVRDLTRYQVGAVDGFASGQGAALHHLKPHGALYAMLARDERLMEAVCDVAEQYELVLLGLAGTAHERVARRRGIPFVSEFFVDLDYDDDGMIIVNRAGAERDLDEVTARARRAMDDGVVESRSGRELAVEVGSFCVHSDLPNAVAVAGRIRSLVDRTD